MFVGRAFHGEPIKGRTLVWIGEGNVPNDGVSLQNYWFPEDRLAIGVGVDRIAFRPPGGSVIGWEFEARMRYHCLEMGKVGLFADLNGGWMVSERRFPPEGTRSNYTFSFGPGLEIPLRAGFSMLLGVELHHWSNARGRYATDNPAQNELFPWVGFGIPW